jgi:hypothetical protein
MPWLARVSMPASCLGKEQSHPLSRLFPPLAASGNRVFRKRYSFGYPGLGVGDFPAGCSECRPPEETRGSLAEGVLEGGVESGSGIGWSAGKVGVVESAWVLPLSRLASRSGVWCRIGVRALSRVLDRSVVLGAGDCSRPYLTELVIAGPVIFRLAPEE